MCATPLYVNAGTDRIEKSVTSLYFAILYRSFLWSEVSSRDSVTPKGGRS
jgi:hypothetical protein